MNQYQPSSWNLQAIQPKSAPAALQEIEKNTLDFEKKRSRLNTLQPAPFLLLVQELEQLVRKMEMLAAYAHLRTCEDVNDQQAAALQTQLDTFLAKISNRLLFFTLWFKQLPDSKAQQFLRVAGKYYYYFAYLRKTKQYTLQENEEKIMTLKDTTGVSALQNVYNIFTTQFSFQFQGKKRTQEEMTTFVRSPSPQVREQAYRTLLAPFQRHQNVIGEIYKNIVNDWREENLHLRGYRSPIHVRNVANDLPDAAVEALLRVCQRNQPLFQRFFEIKRKRLHLKKFRRFDLYAPLRMKEEAIPYDQGVALVLDTFQDFSPAFYAAAKAIIEQQHVHSMVAAGKRPGAFCCAVSTKQLPYVLLSYTNKFRDVSTLAHELGHGIHYVLAAKQTEFTHSPCLPLAETASIFSEMLLSERMLQRYPAAAQEMLFTKIDDLYASIIRQAGFVRFERQAHQLMQQGKTIQEMSGVYLEGLKQQLGKQVAVDDIFAYEWAYIPHIFHTPFYCYAYAFGNLLTLALYQTYKEQGKRFVPKIVDMLAKGGGEPPQKVTEAVGVDITSEKFWQKGFDAITGMIQQVDR